MGWGSNKSTSMQPTDVNPQGKPKGGNDGQGNCEHGGGCSGMATTIASDGRKMCNTHG